MKKSLLLIAISALLLTGCETQEPVDKGLEVNIETIPYDDLQYNEKTLSLKDISVYRETSSSGHGYYPYIIVTLDKSQLTEDDFYWFLENNDIDVSCYYSSEKNDVDFERMPKLKTYYNDTDLVYIFDEYTEEYRYDFSDIEATISIDLTQEEKYPDKTSDGRATERNKVNKYTCYINHITDIVCDVKDISELNEEQERMRQKGLQEVYDNQLNLYNMMLNN